jgi:glucose dehydrogenase
MSRAEAIVVGSGPAGAAAAQALVAAGVDTLLLEAGTRPPEDRFEVMERALLGEIPWESPPYAYEMRGDDIELDTFAIRKLGGSSLAWGAITPRFLPSDFRLRSRHGVGFDWPLSYDELEPHYGAAERLMGISGAQDNPWAAPRSTSFPMPAFPMSDSDLLVKAAAGRAGIELHSVPVARNSTTYDGRSACSYYGTCRACPIGAMYSSDRTIARLEGRRNFRLVTQAEVVRVDVDRGRRVQGVVYLDPAGQEHAAHAPIVILAVQTVETVRILLSSESGAYPRGLANSSGTLGEYFVEHPKFYMRGRVKESLHPHRQGFETGSSYQFHEHPKRGEYAGGRLLVRENAGPSPAMVASRSGRWGRALKDEIREVFGHYVTLGAFLEQLPRAENRISLSAEQKRPDGRAAARVDFTLVSEYEKRGYRELAAEMSRIFDELGATDVEVITEPANSGHYMGGHRMGDDPDTSVVDSYLEAHDVRGLFLASGGVFPTSGIMNPTLTTVALTLRMTDHITRGRTADLEPS